MKPPKDIDSAHRTLLWKAFGVSFPLVGILGWVLFGTKGIWFAAAVCIVVAFGAVTLAGRIGSAAGGLYGGRTPNWNIDEQYAADLSRARVQKMSKNYTEALKIVDKVIDEQPDLNTALFLKAQVLVEGFDHRLEARKCLVKVFQTEPKNSQLYQWSAGLYKQLSSDEQKRR